MTTTPVAVADANAATILVRETLEGMPTADLVAMYNRIAAETGEKPVKKFASRAVAIRRVEALCAACGDGAGSLAAPADETTAEADARLAMYEANAKSPVEDEPGVNKFEDGGEDETEATETPKAKAPKKAKAEAAPKTYRREPSTELKNPRPNTKAARGAALLTRKIGVSLDELQTELGLRDRAAAQTYLSFDIPRATGLGWERRDVDGERRYFALGREGGADGAVVSYATE